ncbi:hypothetical protein H3146_00485 [Streptomyces sp. OF3]|uniref:Uncharacterized protein n=1 Tax=Streptomyces alkaliterrae TaxID=2213162 RepID=A0A5P0YKY6_9ACTN|nr:hypothetical protein [Streptomyces alkaliterrae]MBB1259305.1 hypothetical protein [Streptomyces alkaliterrae]MQS00317.1 hypothetical protein [Streptomyces alkaliterrae]
MPNAEYAVVQTNLRTGAVVTTLPVTGLSYVETLNAAGDATVGMPLFAPEADAGSLTPGGSGLVVLRDGEPVWGGVLWGASADLGEGVLTLNASGYHSYYGRRYLDAKAGYKRKSTDQAVLLREWIGYANANGGIGTDTSTITNTGRVRTRSWSFYEFKCIAEAIDEMADDITGFDFRYESFWHTQGSRVGHHFRISQRGSLSFPQLEHRANCNATNVSYDGTQLTTHAYAFGADLGSGAKPYASSSNPALDTPRMVSVATYSDTKTTASLIPKAAAIATLGRKPIGVPTLTLYPGFSPSQFIPGAVGTVVVDSGGYVALLDEFVITERRVDVDTTGGETVSLSLASREAFIANPS